MRKSILFALSLTAAVLLSGCGNSEPQPQVEALKEQLGACQTENGELRAAVERFESAKARADSLSRSYRVQLRLRVDPKIIANAVGLIDLYAVLGAISARVEFGVSLVTVLSEDERNAAYDWVVDQTQNLEHPVEDIRELREAVLDKLDWLACKKGEEIEPLLAPFLLPKEAEGSGPSGVL